MLSILLNKSSNITKNFGRKNVYKNIIKAAQMNKGSLKFGQMLKLSV